MASENGCGLCKISVNNLGVKKGGDTILSDVSFELHCGELLNQFSVKSVTKVAWVLNLTMEIKSTVSQSAMFPNI